MAPFLGSITSHFSFPWKHLRISEMLLLWFCWVFLSTGKKNGNKNSIPRIASTCDSAVLDMTLMPNWGESRDANQSLLAFESCTLVILIVRDFSLSHFSPHKFYPEGKKTPSRAAQSYENFSFTKLVFSFMGLVYLAFILHCSLNNSLAFQSRI